MEKEQLVPRASSIHTVGGDSTHFAALRAQVAGSRFQHRWIQFVSETIHSATLSSLKVRRQRALSLALPCVAESKTSRFLGNATTFMINTRRTPFFM